MLPPNAAVRLLALQYAPLVSLIGQHMVDGFLDQNNPAPGIAYRQVGGDEPDDEAPIDPDARGTSGKAESRFWFISTVKGPEGSQAKQQAKAIDAALRKAILGYQGTVSNTASPVQTLHIQGIFFVNTRDFYDDETRTHQVGSEYVVHHETERP